jgi:hypothetical protein
LQERTVEIRQQEPAAVSRTGWRKYGSATPEPRITDVLSLAAFAGKVLCLAVFASVLLHAGISP